MSYRSRYNSYLGQIRTKSDQPLNHIAFSSIEDQIAQCSRAMKEGRAHRHHYSNSGFVGRQFSNWNEAVQAANEPWQEGLDIVQEMVYDIRNKQKDMPRPVDRRRKRLYSEDNGDEVNFDRLRAGQGDYWETTSRQTTRAPQYITIVADVGTSAFVSWQDVLWRGAGAMVLSDILEDLGYRVELYGTTWSDNAFYMHGGSEAVWITTKLKDASCPLDTSAVVNALSGWYYRTIYFQSYYVPPRTGYNVNRSLGSLQQYDHTTEHVQQLAGNNSKILVIRDCWSLEAAKEFIVGTINSMIGTD